MYLHKNGDEIARIVTSASDLTAASDCEFAFLRRVDYRLGRDIELPDTTDSMLARAAELGNVHEERVLAAYREQYGVASGADAGHGVVEVPRAGNDAAALAIAEGETLAALQAGADVVFQATFFDPQQLSGEGDDPDIAFVGYADFLVRKPGEEYEVQDTKLARRAKVTALMQLAAYAEQLERLKVEVSPEVVLILGDGARSVHHLSDIAPVFRARRERLHELLLARVQATGSDGKRESAAPIAWQAAGISACGRCDVCEAEVQRTRDPLLIAGLRVTQRDKLFTAGLTTIDEIAAAPEADVPGISAAVYQRLQQQAAVQIAGGAASTPEMRVVDAAALAAIPAPSVGDLFFDFEGDPMYRSAGSEDEAIWGLDYLFGMVDAAEKFTPLWAHDLAAEKQALLDFLQLVAARRALHPDMHIYHYAAYERTHLLSIAARHGVGEAEVDQLLREDVLVDLYPIVKRSLIVGSRSYSIKKLEPLYMGDELRDEDGVTNGADSVVEYAEASAQLLSVDAEQRAEGERRLAAIADYNRYDCVSTLRLRDWLQSIAREHGVAPFVLSPREAQGDETEQVFELSPLAAALAKHAAEASDASNRKAAALAGSAIDYYQREHKSFWWEHFARLVDPIEDWADTRGVLIINQLQSAAEFGWQEPVGRQRNYRRTLHLRGEFAPGSTVKPGDSAFLIYQDPPFDFDGIPGVRGAVQVQLDAVIDNGVIVTETRGGEQPDYSDLPVALTPGPPPRPGTQKVAIEEWGKKLVAAFDSGEDLADPVYDVMRRQPPRVSGGLVDVASAEALTAGGGDEEARTIGALVSSLLKLERSAIAVQGPPGTGKTYLSAHVVRTLVEQYGWHIGVVAQSHKVVENVLTGVVRAGLPATQVAKVPQGGAVASDAPQPIFTALPKNGHDAYLRENKAAGRGAVIGGTAWDFSSPARIARGSLDLLVVDEAGQFSLAPTIAAAVSAQRLLLLGDPQQLPQVSQGSHPEPVDSSALGWLLGEHTTLTTEQGYFLAETRRMRPELAAVVSELSYGGRLHAHPSASEREVLGAGPAGLVWHPVSHAGNATSSVEEAAEVVRIAQQSLNGEIVENGERRPLTQHDLIVVVPYNAHLECVAEALAAAGLTDVRVGTVDKFQGQEAVIAIVSLAASSSADVPRGLEFLLMRNRLNVAISRAQWAAHLVSSDRLGDGLPSSAEGLAALSGYLRLLERATLG